MTYVVVVFGSRSTVHYCADSRGIAQRKYSCLKIRMIFTGPLI